LGVRGRCSRGRTLRSDRVRLRVIREHWPKRASRHLELDDGVTDADDAAREDVGVDSGSVGELLDDPRSSHRLEMPTRLAEFHAEALDFADAKAFANKGVDIHITHR
jgi:hypothetical protein